MFDDENKAKVRRPIGAIDHDGWTYITYGPHDDWGPHPVQNPNDIWTNFAQAANNFVQAVNTFVNTANAPTAVVIVELQRRQMLLPLLHIQGDP